MNPTLWKTKNRGNLMFLEKARTCRVDQKNDFEAFLEASIIYTRSAMHRLQKQYQSHPKWKPWWDSLRSDPSIAFVQDERNWILKEAPPKIGQVIHVGPQPSPASSCYFYETSVPATDTVSRHLERTAELIADGERRFR